MINCVICGAKGAKEVTSKRVVHLLDRAESYAHRSFACASCGESFTNDEQGLLNEAAQRKATARALAEIGASEMKLLRELTGVTQSELENALGLGRNTVARWETGQRPLPSYIKNMLRLLALNPSALLLLRDQDLAPSDRTEVPLGGTIKTARSSTYVNHDLVGVGSETSATDEEDEPNLANVIRLALPQPNKNPWGKGGKVVSLEHSG